MFQLVALNPFQPSFAFYKETSHLIDITNQMTSFYMKCNTMLKCVEIYTMIKAVYYFNWLPWTFTRSNLNQKILKFYMWWVHQKNQCRSTVKKHALLWNKHEYQHSADIFVKSIFSPFHGTALRDQIKQFRIANYESFLICSFWYVPNQKQHFLNFFTNHKWPICSKKNYYFFNWN